MKRITRLTETDLHRIVKESVNGVLKEHDGTYETIDDYYESFYENVLEANAALYRALSFCGEDMKNDALVKRARKVFQATNDMAYPVVLDLQSSTDEYQDLQSQTKNITI